MVDTERRKKLALHLRQLSTGQISNDEFEEKVMKDVTYNWLPEQYYRAKECKTDDPVIRPILEFSWLLYSDTRNHKLIGDNKLSDEQNKTVARLILFLYTDLEYDWVYLDFTNPLLRLSFTDILKSIITLGFYYRNIKLRREKETEVIKKTGDFEFWPFKTEVDYEGQLEKQPFLKKK